MDPIPGRLIWSDPRPCNETAVPYPDKIRLEFPALIRFKDHWYCAFREGQIHHNHPSGIGHLIRSTDGVKWESVRKFEWDAGDVREPKLSITPDGNLVVMTSVYFVSKQPHDDGHFYLIKPSRETYLPTTSEEQFITQQTVTWITTDGEHWEGPFAPVSAANVWLWDLVWHNGMGYSVAEWGVGVRGQLYRTRDAKSWQVLAEDCSPEGKCNEGALAFGHDDRAFCLLRGTSATIAKFGSSVGPYYQKWDWKTIMVDWQGDGNLKPIHELMRVEMGGPKLMCLSDGRLVGGGRTLPPPRPTGIWRVDPADPDGREDGRVTLFWFDPDTGVGKRFAEMDGTSYVGMHEHEGELWITFCAGDRSGIALARVSIPPKA